MLIKACKFLFLFFALSSVSCASEKPADVAYEFLNEYYAVKDIRKVEKYLHKDLSGMIDSDNQVTKEMWEFADHIVNSWEEYRFNLIEEIADGESTLVIFSINGIKEGNKSEGKVRLWMRQVEDQWRVYAIG